MLYFSALTSLGFKLHRRSPHLTLASAREVLAPEEKKSGNVGLGLSAPRDLEKRYLWKKAEADGT